MKFTAHCSCPKCGRDDWHFMREPKPAPSAEEMSEWESTRIFTEINAWGSLYAVTRHYWPPAPRDESVFEVIRICRECSHEWGQT